MRPYRLSSVAALLLATTFLVGCPEEEPAGSPDPGSTTDVPSDASDVLSVPEVPPLSDPGADTGPPSCVELCPNMVAAACPAGPADVAACEAACAAIAAGACADDYERVVFCATARGAVFQCGANGVPFAAGCEEEADDYGQCELTAACAGICPAVLAAGCNAGPADEAACVADCVATANGPCAAEQLALAVCGGDAPTYQCHATAEQAFPTGCDSEADAFFACLAAL